MQLFGPHLILDGSQCDTQKLGDRILIEQILNDYPAAIGMTKIGGPYMFEYQAPDPAYSGVSGIVVIAESHIAIHTFPALDYFSMDIFSCKNFDHEKAIQYIQDALNVKQMDRMLVQRGLSFRGPHHGANGATDELIAAAQQRLAAGIVSNETVSLAGTAAARSEHLARRSSHLDSANDDGAAPHTAPSQGRMVWPTYGISPDLGTYGPDAQTPLPPTEQPREPLSARGQARIVALDGTALAPSDHDGKPLRATEPFQINPTASISGLLDKMSALSSGAGALGHVTAEWERMVRDPHTAIVLAVSTPIVAAGMREVLVYIIERGFVDGVVVSSDDIFADVLESLGHVHFIDGGTPVANEPDRQSTLAYLANFVATFNTQHGSAPIVAHEFLGALGRALPTQAPRKGFLHAAANAHVPVFCSDLASGQFGLAFRHARASGSAIQFDSIGDVARMSMALTDAPHVGIVCVGSGAATSLALQAYAVEPRDGESRDVPRVITLGTAGLPAASTRVHASADVDVTVSLPLVVTALAQRLPARHLVRSPVKRSPSQPEREHALA